MAISSQTSSAAQQTQALSASEAEGFEQVLSRLLGGYRSRNRNLVAFASGVLAAPSGPVRMPQIAAAAGCRPSAFRRLLDDVELDEGALRRSLVATAPAKQLRALTVETEWVSIVDGRHGNGRQIFSIHAVTDSANVPIGWSAVDTPPPSTQREQSLAVLEAAAIAGLVRQTARDYAAVDPTGLSAAGSRPVVLFDDWYGTNEELRRALGLLVAEYSLAVSGLDVLAHPLRREPDETVDPERSVAEHFDPLRPHVLPMAREIVDGSPSRHGREYVTALSRDGAPSYAIVRPFVPIPPGGLLGRRPEQRAADIAALAASLDHTEAARRLRVRDFLHPDSQGVRRQALLASVLEALREGALEGLAA